jgi:membrane protein DedA with SNARE-associated domain/membrane-associated phospholipid phosphatase
LEYRHYSRLDVANSNLAPFYYLQDRRVRQPLDIHILLDWIAQHPHWSLVAIFVIALTESLAVVGLIVPGAVLMVSAGALIGMGVIGFWPMLLAAIAGAFVGDGISFWIGHHFQQELRRIWPFSRYPRWLDRGERYFHRHGGKSVLFGRFVGPVRPFVPVVAGMLGMRPGLFYGINLLSAVLWAPSYLLPGMAFGASLALAGEVAARLAVMLLLLGSMVWFVLWFMHRLYLALSPRAGRLAEGMLDWGGRHPRLNQIIRGLLDPAQPEFKTLLILAGLLIGTTFLFFGLLEDVVSNEPLVRVDQGVYQLFLNLRTPWGDRIMVFATELGDGVVIGLVAVGVLAWLLWQRNWRVAGYWTAAIVFGQCLAFLIKVSLQRPRPLPDFYDGLSSYAFPSGHATMSTVAYGFLAVLVARQLSLPRRWVAYATAAILICLIALSRLYLGAHWLSDVLGGLSLGLAWVSLLGIAYYRHMPAQPLPGSLPGIAIIVLAVAGGWHITSHFSADLERYAPRPVVLQQDANSWWQDDWRGLPAYRRDLEGEYEQPLNLQWSGDLDALGEQLRAAGWRDPVALKASTALRWLQPKPALADLPILPQVHNGRHEALLMVGPPAQQRAAIAENQQLLLRLWNSGIVLEPGDDPLWIGNVTLQQQQQFLLLRLPVTLPQYDLPRQILMQSLDGIEQREVRRSLETMQKDRRWDGGVLLLRAR